jgi:hypothetical protein
MVKLQQLISAMKIHRPMLILGSHDSVAQQVVSKVTKQQYSCEQVLHLAGHLVLVYSVGCEPAVRSLSYCGGYLKL